MRFLMLAALGLTSMSPAQAAGDAVLGQTLYTSRCGACHSLDSNRAGPKHRGVVGRKAGSVADFSYSAALQKAKFVWTPQKLNKWLQGPSKLVRGTVMAFTVSKPEDRAAIIAYLAAQK